MSRSPANTVPTACRSDVDVLLRHAHVPPADLLDERALDPAAVPKPVAVLMARPGVPSQRVEAGGVDLLAVHPDRLPGPGGGGGRSDL